MANGVHYPNGFTEEPLKLFYYQREYRQSAEFCSASTVLLAHRCRGDLTLLGLLRATDVLVCVYLILFQTPKTVKKREETQDGLW